MRLKKILAFLFFLTLCSQNAFALVDFSDTKKEKHITATGFIDYPPYGYSFKTTSPKSQQVRIVYESVFEELLSDFGKENNTSIEYITPSKRSYNDRIHDVRSGNIDILLGMYHDTKSYEGIDYVIPALITNPITLMTLPNKRGKINSLEDVKKLHGAILEKEILSDFVVQELKNYDIEKIKEPNELFRKLFTGEIDYVFIGYYNGIIEASKLGLRRKVAFSKQIIWDMPLFIGVSKVSENRNFLIARLGKYSEQAEVQKKFKKYLLNIIHKFESINDTITPPIYTK